MSTYSRLNRDRKIGYAALLVGAAAFVALLVGQGSIVDQVRERLPEGIPGATTEPPAIKGEPQKGVVIALRAARERGDDQSGTPDSTGSASGGDGGAVDGDRGAGGAPQSNGGSTAAANQVPGTQPEPDPGPGPGPGPGGGDDDGPVSSIVDPVVTGVTGTVDDVTGGATTPVTDVADDTVDGVTDVLDGLLGNGNASAQGATHANSNATDKTKKHESKKHESKKHETKKHGAKKDHGKKDHAKKGQGKGHSKHPGKHHRGPGN